MVTLIKRMWRRNRFPAGFSHMESLDSRLYISETDSVGERCLYWDGSFISKIRDLSNLDRQTNKSCFIVANGPSVSSLDLSLIPNECLHGVNASVIKFEEFGKRASGYTISDPSFFEKQFSLVEKALNHADNFYLTADAISRICKRKPQLLARSGLYLYNRINKKHGVPALKREDLFSKLRSENNILLAQQDDLNYQPGEKLGRRGFSSNTGWGCFSGATVVYDALQIAFMAGCNTIYLVGMDLGGQTSEGARFYQEGKGTRKSRLERDYGPIIEPSFKLASAMARNQGIEIFNLSPESRLPDHVLPKISLEQALDRSAQKP